MEYPDALDYLYSRLPVFHRIGPKALKPGLANILRLCEAIGDPQTRFRSIHVGGTNGKGSTSHMLATIYQTAGYRVGLYTSPHLKSFTERIRINGQPIAEEAVARFVTTHQQLIESIEPSFFEVTVAMAFDYFASQGLDIAIIEVGLGGRLDSTNIITPLASVITHIGYDHTDILGDTLPQIAGEKAGIIKPGVPVIIGETHTETEAVFRKKATEEAAPILFADQQYHITSRGIENGIREVLVAGKNKSPFLLSLDLLGEYQLQNLGAVLTTTDVLQSILPISLTDCQTACRSVVVLTGLKGRFQQLGDQPRIIADTAHNKSGLAALLTTVGSIPHDRLHIIMGLVADKPAREVLEVLPPTASYYFCQAESPRSLPALLLQVEASQLERFGESYSTVNLALAAAVEDALPSDLILITGSNYVVAELTDL